MASPPQAPSLIQRAEDFLHAAYGSLTESDRSKLPPLERALADPKFYSFSPSDQAWALSKLSPEFDAFSDKDKQYAVTQLNTRWKAKHPPLLSRIETAVAGPSTLLGKEGKSTTEQIFAPALLGVEAALHPNTPVVNLGALTSGPGAARGALNAVSGLMTPANIALMSGGVGALDSVAEKLIGKYGPRAVRALVDAGFARNLFKQAEEAGNQVEALYKAGKPDEARQALTNFLASSGFGTVAGVSALKNAFGDLFPAPRAPKHEEPKTINVKARVEEAPKAQPQSAAVPIKERTAGEPEKASAAPVAPSEIFSAHDFKVAKSDVGNTVTFRVKSSTGKALGPAKVLIQPDGTAVVETKPDSVSEESIRQRARFHLQKKQAKQPPKAPAVEVKPEATETVSPVPESIAEVPETAAAPKEEPKLEPAAKPAKSAALHTAEQVPAGTVVYFWNLPDAIKGMTGPWEKLPDGAWRNNQHGQLATSQSVAEAIEKAPQTHQITAPQTEHIEALGIQPLRETPVAVTPEAVSSTPEEPKASIPLPEEKERKGDVIAPQEQAVLEKSAIPGSQTLIKTPSGDMPVRYAVVDVSALIPSHNPMTFAKNAGYPEGIQERSYHSDKHAQSRVIENAQKHDAAFLLNSNPDAINGPPVVGRSGIVYGGNGRSMSLARVYASGKGDSYRNALIEAAPMFGIDSQSVSTMSHPVLVREIDDDALDMNSKRRLVSDLNRPFTGGLTSSQKAVSAGQSISRQTLEYVDGVLDSLGDQATIKQAIDSRGKKILNMMLEDGAITSMELPQMTDHKTGEPNQRGREFIEQALLGSVLADSDTIDRSPKYALNKIMGALPALSRLAVRTDEWNFIPSLRQALNEYALIKSSGEKVSDYLSNILMFGERNPVVDALVVAIDQPEPHGIGMKPKNFRSALNRYVADSEIDRPGQSILGVFETPSAAKVFNETFGTTLTDEDYGKWIVKSLLEDNDAENAKADSLRATQSQPLAPTRSVQDEGKIEPISVEHRGKEEHITLGDQKYILSKSKAGPGYGIHRKGKYVGEAFDREDAVSRIKIDADKGCK